jgi:hypothetical protein
MNTVKSGIWQHYKGNKYLVLGTGKHSETEEAVVIYVPMCEHPEGGPGMWVRPLEGPKGFLTPEVVNEKKVPRFTYIGDVNPPQAHGTTAV